MTQDTGLAEYIAWDSTSLFPTPPGPPPVWKIGYTNVRVGRYLGEDTTLWKAYIAEIDSGRPVKVDFRFWNPQYVSFFVDTLNQDTFYVYLQGDTTSSSGPNDPPEVWNFDVGHAVTGVGYIPNWNGINWAIVHDNWPSTFENVVIPWGNLMALVTVYPPPPSRVVGHWPFDEGSGSVAHDETNNHNDGTITGASWTTGISGNALYFHGGGQWFDGDGITVPHSSSLDITDEFTVEAWIKAKGSDNYLAIVDKYEYQTSLEKGLTLYLTNGKLRLTIYSATQGQGTVIGTSDLRDDTLHHVAGTWNGSYIRVYVDGKMEGEVAWSFAPASTTNDLGIGKRLSGWGGYMPFLGVIDEVKIFDGALSTEEIKEEFEAGFDRGDGNGDGVINSADIVYLINYLFIGGPAPVPLEAGDANCDGVVNIADVVYLINYLFIGGPPPCEGKGTASSGSELYKGKAPAQIGFSSPNISSDGLYEVPVVAEFDVDLSAVQLEIKYDPEKISLWEPALTPRSEGLSIYSSLNEGIQKIDSLRSLQVGIIDLGGQHYISAGTGALVYLKMKGLDWSSLQITQAILVDREAQKIPVQIVSKREKSEEELEGDKSAIPQEFSLSQNYPNPFNPETEIKYALPQDCDVKLVIYNVTGRKLRTLVNEHQAAGHKSVFWDSKDDKGKEVSSGIYLYKIEAGDFKQSRKMVLVK